MATVPPLLAVLLENLTTALPALLGGNLVGVYLYGSLTQDAFDQDHSDVDCIVVTQNALTDAQFTALDVWLTRAAADNPWVARLQMSLLRRDHILRESPDGDCLYQFGQLTRVGSDGNPIIWMNVLKSGITLLGPSARSFVPTITSEMLAPALTREVGYLREELVDAPTSDWRDVPKYRVYAVLTLCRILYTHAHGIVVSKPEAAAWALRSLPQEWHDLIRRSLEPGAVTGGVTIDLAGTARFIAYADARLRE